MSKKNFNEEITIESKEVSQKSMSTMENYLEENEPKLNYTIKCMLKKRFPGFKSGEEWKEIVSTELSKKIN